MRKIRKGSFKEKSKKNFFPAGVVYDRDWIWERRKNKKKRIGKTRQREDEGGNGGEKMKNEIPKKVPKDGAKGQKWSSEIQCLCGFPGSCYVV